MISFLPRSLTAQTIWVLLIGLSVSHFLSMMIYSGDRIETLSMMGGRNMAQRVASISHLINETPIKWRERILSAVNDPTFKVSISPESELITQPAKGQKLNNLEEYLRYEIGVSPATPFFVQLIEHQHTEGMLGFLNPKQWTHMQNMSAMHGITSHQSLRVSFQLHDRNWLNFTTHIPETNSWWSITSIMSLLSMGLAVVVLAIWVVRRITVPLRTFGNAAQRLGKDVKAPPMAVEGPTEVQEAAKAFNDMQARLQRLIENRTQLMAAISHDLRTPITLLRLRTELIENAEDRDKMLATLDEMEHMISLTLKFAKQDAENEERKKVDIAALLESICDDMEDAGKNVHFEAENKLLYLCAPIGMKRAVSNLIENALKYAGNAEVFLQESSSTLTISIEDDGPGIPEEHLPQIIQPFYRCEGSRNRETGGVGLGLSVVQSVVEAHGGELIFQNKSAGGLIAQIQLPK